MKNTQEQNTDSAQSEIQEVHCRFCKTKMLQFDKSYIPSFVCPKCGGSLTIDLQEKTFNHGSRGLNYDRPIRVLWSKAKLMVDGIEKKM